MHPAADNYSLIAKYYEAHRDELLRFVTAICGDAFSAEDIVQEVFLRILQGNQLITVNTLPNLTLAMAKNIMRDKWRHRQCVDQYEHFIRNTYTGAYNPESVYSARQMTEMLEQGIARLDSTRQTIYRMNLYDGMKVAEISHALHACYKTVEHQLGMARKSMRQYMKRRMA